MDELEEALLQTGLQTMARHQKPETRELIWTRHQARFGEHIRPLQAFKPATTVVADIHTAALVPGKASRFTDVPPEIMEIVFNACDLETCVSLREVSSAWYLFSRTRKEP